jgi:predicted N-acetyltransferase YhbS
VSVEPSPLWTIRREAPADASLVEALNADSFGPGRFAKSAYRLREGVAMVADLAFVAMDEGALRGSVRFWPVAVGGQAALLLGPLAVETGRRGRGMGIALMRAGLAAAKAADWGAVLLVGDEPYYARVGFARIPPGKVLFPGPVDPDRLLWLALKDGAGLCGPICRS